MNQLSLPNLPRLTAFIITKNEAHNVPECLASLSFCDEVIVLDNGSTDETVKIAREAGARVVETEAWLGYGPQKQLALELSQGRWVLSIDADERVSNELAGEILQAVESDQDLGYSIKRENYFLGKRMKFGGWARDRVVRLALAERCHFSPDMVHECMICEDPIKSLNGPLYHLSYQSIDEVFEKQVRYAKLGAVKLRSAGITSNSPLLKASWTFVRLYAIQLGFLDGWRGTLSAVAKSYETFWRYALSSRKHQRCTSES